MSPINYAITHTFKPSRPRRDALHPRIMLDAPETIAAFWSLVDKTDDCWLWRGKTLTSPFNYGVFHSRAAHRYAYRLAHGPIRSGMYICHTCDVPRCVRPDHLFEGTPRENVRDMIEKNRQRRTRTPHPPVTPT